MKKNAMMIAALIVLHAGLAACGKKAEAPPADAMANMAMPANAKMGQSSGTVVAVDQVAGKITLDHGPIPAVGWPAMTMGFDAKPDLLKDITVGDKVSFEIEWNGKSGQIVKLAKQYRG